MPQFRASLSDYSRGIIYNSHKVMIEATDFFFNESNREALEYCKVLILFNIFVKCSNFLSCHQVTPCIVKAPKKHLDPIPNGDFLALHCLGIGSSVSGIQSDRIGKYMAKI